MAVRDDGDASVLDYLPSKGVRITTSDLCAMVTSASKNDELGMILENIGIQQRTLRLEHHG